MTNTDSIIQSLQKAKRASKKIALLSDDERSKLVNAIADALTQNMHKILDANTQDCALMNNDNPKKDRLILTNERLNSIADDAKSIASLPDPTRQILLEKTLDNGLKLKKISVPLGVVGIIYESRPNVTVDVAALCLRSGNAVVLRGGSDAEKSNQAIASIIHDVLKVHDLPTEIVTLLPTDRKFVNELLTAEEYIDILIPRGSKQLIDFVRENSRIPTIETGAGVCHTFVDKSAALDKAKNIVINAKISRPSVCNSLDTILVHKDVAEEFLPMITEELSQFKVEIYADHHSYKILSEEKYPHLQKAKEEDYGREFLDYKCSIKIANDLQQALEHIEKYSSKHSEAIIAEDKETVETFLQNVDAASVYSNASTRFTDGGVFGLGAEIGISTQKLHARGPFALEKLVTEKWVVRGDGQIRDANPQINLTI